MMRYFPRVLPYLLCFFSALVLSLVLTPLVRSLCRRLGMVDRPDARRINTVPIPRGGGLAVVATATILSVVFDCADLELSLLGLAIAALGFVDDRFSLAPRIKLAGQAVVAFAVWSWAGFGFADLWPALPPWLDCVLTVLWIVGAVNAFNLIDGLDGLASGLALIATLGMAGVIVFLGRTNEIRYPLVFAGALLGFLRYNYNPASVFLGDCGSMFLGFVLAVLPLKMQVPNSFLVSVGVPLLAMGVPIFDTALAILRRSIRHLLRKGGAVTDGTDRVMTADAEHLHHRILRSVGLNQRKAAWILYGMACFLVAVGLVGINLKSHRAGLWLIAVTVAAVVVFRDMARVELYDAGKLLGALAHTRNVASRRRLARLAVPFYLAFDVVSLVAVFFLTVWLANKPFDRTTVLVALPIRVFSTFACLVFFRAYVTVWSRAMLSNYVRLFAACALGSIVGTLGIYFAPTVSIYQLRAMTLLYAVLPFLAIVGVRMFRGFVRDLFYTLDCKRLVQRKDVSRLLVYGTDLHYRAFRRLLVRSTSANTRIIVGLLDDNLLLRGHYIGGIRVLGTLADAVEAINALNVDTVVLACDVSESWMKVVRETLAPTGVKIVQFTFNEKEL